MTALFWISLVISVLAGLAFLMSWWNQGWKLNVLLENWPILFLAALSASGCIMPDVTSASIIIAGSCALVVCIVNPEWASEMFEKYAFILMYMLGSFLLASSFTVRDDKPTSWLFGLCAAVFVAMGIFLSGKRKAVS